MERETMKDLLGARQYLAGALTYQVEDGEVRTGRTSASDAIITYCYCKGSIDINGFLAIKSSYDSSRDMLVSILTENGVEQIDQLLNAKLPLMRSSKAEGTTDSFNLAREIIDLLKQMSSGDSKQNEQQKPNNKPDQDGDNDEKGENQSSQSQQNSDQQEANSDSSSDEQSEAQIGESKSGEQPEESNPNKGEGSEGVQDDQDRSDAKGSNESDGKNEGQEGQNAERCNSSNGDESDKAGENDQLASGDAGKSDSVTDAQKEQMKQGAQSMLNDHNVDSSEFVKREQSRDKILEKAKANGVAFTDNVNETGGESGVLSDSASSYIGNDLNKFNLIKASINGDIAKLKRKLIPKLQSNNRSTTRLTEDRGRLDIRAAIRSVTSVSINQAVYREKVRQVVTRPAITLLIDRSGSMGKLMESAQKAAVSLLEVCDSAAIKVEVIAFDHNVDMVKSFEQPTNKAKAKIGGLTAAGGTDTAKAMYQSGKRLIQRSEQRKIMMVITDGEPASIADAKSVQDLLVDSGIEVYGLGLGTEAVKHFCNRYALVTPDNLATTILQSLEG
jgi:cobalamin biosynthesis protein CobT